ncbi:MAG TPA: hypothetical protein VLQ45_13445, partial [Thermoanaerobaculia bacterium]|nr:hypothetical protein [Thermoanaerobaculia bacterium]
MDAVVLPLVSEEDSPEAAIHQMNLANVHAVVEVSNGRYRLLTNEKVLEAWAGGIVRLADFTEVGEPMASLSDIGLQVWPTLGTAQEVFSPDERMQGHSVSWQALEPSISTILNEMPSDFGVLPAQGGAALVLTRHESLAIQIRSRTLLCRCPHSPDTLAEDPPSVKNGAPCVH